MRNYPKSKRDIYGRLRSKTKNDKLIAQRFGKDFFDGSRNHGYGGFSYNPRFWQPVIPTFQKHWNLNGDESILDIGCAKGFMLYDFKLAMPEIKVYGVDISEYAIDNAIDEVKDYCKVYNATNLPFDDKSIDVSISITTLHNLDEVDLITALSEIERVTRRGSFITLDAFYYLTGGLLNYDENVLDKVLKVNSHKEKYNKIKTDSRNLECHDETWREWSSSVRQDIFMEILSKEDIFVYQEHGYNLDFIY